jgi:hypothetical protein
LTKSAEQALAYERGEVLGHRVTRIAVPWPPRPLSSADIARIRQQLNQGRASALCDQGAREPREIYNLVCRGALRSLRTCRNFAGMRLTFMQF